ISSTAASSGSISLLGCMASPTLIIKLLSEVCGCMEKLFTEFAAQTLIARSIPTSQLAKPHSRHLLHFHSKLCLCFETQALWRAISGYDGNSCNYSPGRRL